MTLTPVKSSNLSAIGYNESEQWLFVQFKIGTIYRYSRVPIAKFEAFLKASSKGTFLNDEIKDKFSFVKIKETSSG